MISSAKRTSARITDIMLRVEAIDSAYGTNQVLFGMSLTVSRGEVVTLLGRNGMGKTTTIRSIMGQLRPTSGSIRFNDQEIIGWPPFRIARSGIGLAPEGRHVFPNLSTQENLIATANNDAGLSEPWNIDKIMELFPALQPRIKTLGVKLSGGEQQMLSIGRALMTNPKLLLLDEATEGLSPLLRRQIWASIAKLKDNNQSILLIDKNLESLIRIGDRHYIVEKGQVVWSGNSSELKGDAAIQRKYLGV